MVFNPDTLEPDFTDDEVKEILGTDEIPADPVPFNVSRTMKVLKRRNKKIDYIVLRIDGKSYSTPFADINSGKINGTLQRVDTTGIGEQDQLWIKSYFSEGSGHQKLPENKPFELNVYFNEDAI